MSFLDLLATLVIYTLAADAVLHLWNEGSLFASKRSEIESEAFTNKHPLLAELAQCKFCQSFHIPFWLLLLFHVPGLIFPAGAILRFIPIALACTRLMWSITDVR